MKKLLGLLAVAPMALAACGGSETTTTKHYDATAYGSTHGFAVFGSEYGNDQYTVAADKTVTRESLGLAEDGDCTSITDAADIASVIIGRKFDPANDYTVTGSIALTDSTATDADGKALCNAAADTVTIQAGADTVTNAGITKVQVNLDSEGKVEELTIDETSGDFFSELHTVANHVQGFRILPEAVANASMAKQDSVSWKRDDSAYMVNKWNPTMDAIVATVKGKTFAEIDGASFSTDIDFTGITGASENMSDGQHYVDVIIEAVRIATEAHNVA